MGSSDDEMMEFLEGEVNDAMDIDLVGHDDGVLRDGVFESGQLPMTMWSEDDYAAVVAWLATLGVDAAAVRRIVVHRPTMTLYPIHAGSVGQPHLIGHCNGESMFVELSPATNLLSGDYLAAKCAGCGMHLGEISKTQRMEDYSKVLRDQHVLCLSDPVEVEIGP